MARVSKRIVGFTLVVLTAFSMWGCKKTPENPAPSAPQEKDRYEFQGVGLDMEFQEALEVFGPYEMRIQEDALLTTYTFAHFLVVTYQKNGTERIHAISLRSSAVATEEGTVIGDTRTTVMEKQGEVYIPGENGYMNYIKKDTVLSFLLDEDGYVLSIEYSMISEE